ncbi:MAG: hypothetical protein ACLR6T_03585 [Intestinibacter sp.]
MNFYGFLQKIIYQIKMKKRLERKKQKIPKSVTKIFRCHRSHSRRRVKKSYYCTNVEM